MKLRRLDHQPPTVSQDCVEDSVTPISLRLNFSLVGEPAHNYGGLRPVLGVDALRLFTASVSREDPLEQERATHSSILAWKIPWMEEPGGLHSSWSREESDTTEQLTFSLYFKISLYCFVSHPVPISFCFSHIPCWQLPFEKNCGNDTVCQDDLSITFNFMG